MAPLERGRRIYTCYVTNAFYDDSDFCYPRSQAPEDADVYWEFHDPSLPFPVDCFRWWPQEQSEWSIDPHLSASLHVDHIPFSVFDDDVLFRNLEDDVCSDASSQQQEVAGGPAQPQQSVDSYFSDVSHGSSLLGFSRLDPRLAGPDCGAGIVFFLFSDVGELACVVAHQTPVAYGVSEGLTYTSQKFDSIGSTYFKDYCDDEGDYTCPFTNSAASHSGASCNDSLGASCNFDQYPNIMLTAEVADALDIVRYPHSEGTQFRMHHWSYINNCYVSIDEFRYMRPDEPGTEHYAAAALHLAELIQPDVVNGHCGDSAELSPIPEVPLFRSHIEHDTHDIISLCRDYINVYQSSSMNESSMWSQLDIIMQEGQGIFSSIVSQWLPLDRPRNTRVSYKDVTVQAMSTCAEVDIEDATAIHIYIDGGFNPFSLVCLWSLAILFVCGNGAKYVCATSGGRRTFDSMHSLFLGESVPGSYSAELYAQVLAHICVMQYFDNFEYKPITIFYDNVSAADTIQGLTGSGAEHQLRCFSVLCKLLADDFSIGYEHVKSHSGDPWNEMDDSLSSYYLDERQGPALLNIPFGPSDNHKIFCLNMYYAVGIEHIAQALSFPESIYEKYDFKFQNGRSPHVIAAHLDDTPADHHAKVTPEVLKGLQYNIQSFRSYETRKRAFSVMRNYRYAFACLQETRNSKNQSRLVNGIVVCSSAGTFGHLGCDVLINTRVAWYSSNCRSIKISRDNVTIVFAEPRILIVCVTERHFVLYIVSAHAPYVGCEDSFSDWWKHFSKILTSKCREEAPVIVCIDANYKCYANVSEGIGDLRILHGGRQPQNHNSFVDFVDDCRMKVHNTFADSCSTGYCLDASTYITSNGHVKSRIDYFMSNKSVTCRGGSIARDEGMSLDIEEKDHLPICGEFAICMKGGSSLSKRRVLGYDRAKLDDPDCCRAFSIAMHKLPSVPVKIDNTSHCFIVDSNLHGALCECFPLDRHYEKQCYISESTLQQVVQCSRLRRDVCRYRSRFDKACLRFGFGAFCGKLWFCKHSLVFAFSSMLNIKLYIGARTKFAHADKACKNRARGTTWWTHPAFPIVFPTFLNSLCFSIRSLRIRVLGKAGYARMCLEGFLSTSPSIITPCMSKLMLESSPPLQWKGGLLAESFKGKGSLSLRSNYSDILLADDSGKGLGKLIRKRFLPFAVALSHDTQYGGGFHGGETAFIQLHVRLYVDAAIHAGLAVGCLYLDVVAAFATMLRRILFNSEEGDEAWLRSLSVAGFGDEDVEAIYSHVCDHQWIAGAIEDATACDPSNPCAMDYNLVEQMYTNSWVSQEYIPNVINITSGSAAGTPIADLLYSMCMSRVLGLFRVSLAKDGLDSSIKINGVDFDVHDVSFIDDTAMPVVSSCEHICKKIGLIAECAFSVFASFGMRLNFNPGKSEATVSFRGQGCKLAARALALGSNSIPIACGHFSSLRVVNSYSHVGTSSPAGYNMCDEVTKRNAMMRSEARNLCKHALRIGTIPTVKKIGVVQAYMLSKGIFQCGTWPMLPDVLYKRFHTTILNVYRNATGSYFKLAKDADGGVGVDVSSIFNDDDDVICQHGFICPRTMLRLARLSLLCRIIRKSPPGLLELIRAQAATRPKRGWVSSLHDDFLWLRHCEDFMQCKSFDVSPWLDHLGHDINASLSKIRKFCHSPFANIMANWADAPVLKVFAAPIQCQVCGHTSKSHQAHAVHLASKHAIKCKFRRFVDGPVCRIRLKNFGTRVRCINHAKKCLVCKMNLLIRGPVISQAEADELNAAECQRNVKLYAAGRRSHHAEVPCIQGCGPLLPIIASQPSSHHALGVGHNFY